MVKVDAIYYQDATGIKEIDDLCLGTIAVHMLIGTNRKEILDDDVVLSSEEVETGLAYINL